MREIKYRGKRIDNGEWAFGYYAAHRMVITGEMDYFIIVNEQRPQSVDPETVGEWTGLRDKNGKEIYENDLVYSSHRIYDDGIPLLNKVEFKDYCWRLVPVGDKNANDAPLNLYAREPQSIEIAGNIFEHPELLEREGRT